VTAIRVVVVDDHRMFLSGVRAEIGGRVDVVGAASTVEAAVALIREASPDVVLLDVHMPDGGGLAVISGVRPAMPQVQFLALSVSDAAEDVIAVVRAGARGYLTKTVSADELVEGIARVHGGDAVFSPRLAGFVLDAFSGAPPARADGAGPAAPDEADLDVLTPREREVLRYIARGYAYKQVASRLHISIKTVETHVSAVLRKLQLSSRYELTRWATDRRLV
jgi:DNA-binding NarL/FixJ family response regulator